jgi:cytochrome P450
MTNEQRGAFSIQEWGPGSGIDWDPTAPATVEQRYEQLQYMRERQPLARAERHNGQIDVLRYEDVVAVAADPERFSNAMGARYGKPLPPLEFDPPEHRDFRRMLAVFFMPRKLAGLELRLKGIAKELLKPLVEAGTSDYARNFSYPLPVLGLCGLLNIPPEHWADIKAWSENTLLMDSRVEEERARAIAGHGRIIEYALTMIADRRSSPRDPEDDVTAALLAARVNGEPLDDDTMARTLRILISAGHNSTTSAIGNAILHLARDQAAQASLRADRAAIPTAIEEILRFDTPVQEMPRWAKVDTEVAGCPISRGTRLGLFWASANRDEAAFPDAAELRLDRTPNRHVAFGHGIHICLGAPMARMEIRVAIEALLDATAHFELAGEVERPGFHRMGVTALPLRTVAASA